MRVRWKDPGKDVPGDEHGNARKGHNTEDHRYGPVIPVQANVHKKSLGQ